MKRTIASLLVILGFGSYAWVEKTKTENSQPNKVKKDSLSTGSTPQISPTVQPIVKKIQQEIVYSDDDYDDDEDDDRPLVVTSSTPYGTDTGVQVVSTTAQQTVPVTTPTKGKYKDGTYVGDSVNVYYGDVQVQALVSGGTITSIEFLTYPQDRDRSLVIADRALPLLVEEAILAQSSQVDVISGATALSDGFIKSLASALAKAQ